MDRTLVVSTPVFAAIWAARREGEDTEDAILSRLLNCASGERSEKPHPQGSVGGVFDARNNVAFNEGFEIFRNYKGKEYKAVATAGAWLRRDNNQRFTTLNQLNASIASGAENVWNGNWRYRRGDGTIGSIAELRR